MDTTELYVKMSDCPEMQDGWEPEHGDVVYVESYHTVALRPDTLIVLYGQPNMPEGIGRGWWIATDGTGPFKEKGIFLRSQSQLQGMVGPFPNFVLGIKCPVQKVWSYIGKFYDWSRSKSAYLQDFTSMEQLWLAFVMHEKHGRVWDGEKWVEVEG